MSLLPAFFGARKRSDDSARQPEPESVSGHDTSAFAETDIDSRHNVFDLVPPSAAADTVETQEELPPSDPLPPIGRNTHPVDMTDLSRLSIDTDGRLYWDGKPVEVRRTILMTRAQVAAASVIAAFIVIGALGAALQGAAAARDWACRLGWIGNMCTGATPLPDIPA